ncbi:DUF4192 family protein [Corynebacterium lowii]|uniref:DUF4192 family protein n=1 Tax=Corynebacterium lowii TaxID=1544413 RepID=UPI000A8356D8|nr:DUF4192 family protein [Corynebacterium lowii]MDP9851223.1 hypothetical protein [Corynebacterium lowii]
MTRSFRSTAPGYLLSNIPAILGFYPTESIILLGLNTAGAHTYSLAPCSAFP